MFFTDLYIALLENKKMGEEVCREGVVSLVIDGVQFVKSHVTLRYVYIHWLCLVTYGR